MEDLELSASIFARPFDPLLSLYRQYRAKQRRTDYQPIIERHFPSRHRKAAENWLDGSQYDGFSAQDMCLGARS